MTISSPALADDSESFKAFQANWTKAEQAYAAKDYRRALAYYEKVFESIPFEPVSRYQAACCHARLGDQEKALALLEAAISHGWDDAEKIAQAEDLKSLRGHTRFGKLQRDASACREESLIIYAGKGLDPAKPAPLVVLLQGLGCGPRAEVPYWKPVADRLGLVLAVPRAPTRVRSMMYGWHRPGARDSAALDYFDMSAAAKRIEAAASEASRRFAIDESRVVVAGFSQGGGVALRILGDHCDKFCGAVAICSLCQPPGVKYWQASAKKHGVKVFVMAGALDKLLPRSQKAVQELRAAGIATRYEEEKRMGHEYPADYAERLSRAVEFVLGREGRGPRP